MTTKKSISQKYILESPNKSKIKSNRAIDLFLKGDDKFRRIILGGNVPRYLYWDDFKHKFNEFDSITTEEQWYVLRVIRDISSTPTPIKSESGDYFKWNRLPYTDEYLHKIDMMAGGQLLPQNDIFLPSNRQIFINRGIIEEAIASSQLEGAHTTRAAAKKMIIEKREPRNNSERMILNNFNTINAIEETYKNMPLTKDLLLEIHSKLTEGTVPEEELKRFRKNKDEIVIEGQIGNEIFITHVPPEEQFLENGIESLIQYANDEKDSTFVHPIIKAIFIHFWIGYLHPFTDGNGRLARALFYWYLLRKGYWTFMYLPISTVIKKAPIKYAKAYIYSEQDNLDLTYFYDFHIHKVLQAISDFQNYINRKIDQNKQIDSIISADVVVNDRQKQLIHYFISDEKPSTTVSSYARINNISRQTSAKDLRELEVCSMIAAKREGKYIRFYPTDRLKSLAKSK